MAWQQKEDGKCKRGMRWAEGAEGEAAAAAGQGEQGGAGAAESAGREAQVGSGTAGLAEQEVGRDAAGGSSIPAAGLHAADGP